MKLVINGQQYEPIVRPGEVAIGDKTFKISVTRESSTAVVTVNDKTFRVEVQGNSVLVNGTSYSLEVIREPAPTVAKPAETKAPARKAAEEVVAGNAVRAHMPGQVVRVLAKEGDPVGPDTVLLVIEAMKMENEIRAGRAGVVKSIPVSAGSSVNQGDILAVLE